jgi:hypothetical protein
LYACGGYVGGHPGPATDWCGAYEVTRPLGSQWLTLNNTNNRPTTSGGVVLPYLPAQRAGGAMWYDKRRHSLTYATGASRPDPLNPIHTIDHNNVWELFLNDTRRGWQTVNTVAPYCANHVGAVTVNYKNTGVNRQYLVGGQSGEDEGFGNIDLMYEYYPHNATWRQRRNLTMKRGHFSESTIPYNGCGFFIIGGSVNRNNNISPTFNRTRDVSYYDITTDTWTRLGDLKAPVPTPICTVHSEYIYCQSGPVSSSLSVRIKIII